VDIVHFVTRQDNQFNLFPIGLNNTRTRRLLNTMSLLLLTLSKASVTTKRILNTRNQSTTNNWSPRG
jgi:hypothetical protein